MSIPRFGPPRAAGYADLDRSLPPSPATPRHPLASPTWTNASTPPASPLRTPNDPLLRRQDLTGSASPQPAPRIGSSPHRSHARSSSVSRRTGRDELAGPYLRSSPFATSRDSLASHSSGVSAAHMGAGGGELGASFGEGTSHSIWFAPDLSEEDRRPERPYSAKEALLDERMHTFQAGDSLSTGDRTSFRISGIGFLNLAAIALIVVTLVTLFAGYPIINWATLRGAHHQLNAYNLGDFRGNGSGQVPEIPGFSGLIDATTPRSAMTRIESDGKKYLLQFSDEFNKDGRTFYPGDDPYWEAVDFHYVITMTKEQINDLDYKSGMLQSWNKFCFTGGYIEVNVSLPGSSNVTGFWPGAWTLGNLARAGYGATTDGTWPYSYSTCDIGTLPNQTTLDGTGPAAAVKLTDGVPLSYQPGQRVSACTCPADANEHPGPNVKVGRGAPEIDILEAQTFYTKKHLVGAVSQSAQFAPYDADYQIRNTTPWTVVQTPDRTVLNSYQGGIYQEACSGVTVTDQTAYRDTGGGFATYGFEYWPDRKDGYITWYATGEPAWTLTAGAVGPNPRTQIGQRLISEEPMSIVLNLGISTSFQQFKASNLDFPAEMLIDYVRVYQREGEENLGCDPPGYPTSKYIEDHLEAYMK
ncbi:hypothetical protein JCM8202v2_004828 [Rhodotorula sphaerocarpa]